MLQGACSVGGLLLLPQRLPMTKTFAQIPRLPARPVGPRANPAVGAEPSEEGVFTLSEKKAEWRDDKPPPPRYDRLVLMPGRAADQSSERPERSAKQSQAESHGAILSQTSIGQPRARGLAMTLYICADATTKVNPR